MKKPSFLALAEEYLSHIIDAEDFELHFLDLRRNQAKSGEYDFNLSDPSVGLGYDLIFSLVDRLYLDGDPEGSDISEETFRSELTKIVERINNGTPQERPF
ncbi:MAG: hypothetical protein KAX62_07330 [Xylophilus sp.]|jgi:hypothetical protein|nr:hypothetical protein [Xylophilus sp.]